MMNRLRTALVSVTAVAVAMMVLGSNARAKSVPSPTQQKYLRLLERLAEREQRPEIRLETRRFLGRRPEFLAVSRVVEREIKTGPTPSQQKYLRLLERLAEGEIKTGISLVQRYSSLETAIDRLEMAINRLENIPHPRPRLAREIAAKIAADSKQESNDFKQESRIFAALQKNTNALLATQADLQALPPQEKAQVSNLLNSIQRLVVEERGVNTPVR